MKEEELKKLDELKEHCLKQGMYNDPHAIEKYRMFETLENKINELQREIKHLKDLQGNLDKQYETMESILDEIRECIDKFPCIHYASGEKVDGKRLSGKLIPVDDLLQILDKVQK